MAPVLVLGVIGDRGAAGHAGWVGREALLTRPHSEACCGVGRGVGLGRDVTVGVRGGFHGERASSCVFDVCLGRACQKRCRCFAGCLPHREAPDWRVGGGVLRRPTRRGACPGAAAVDGRCALRRPFFFFFLPSPPLPLPPSGRRGRGERGATEKSGLSRWSRHRRAATKRGQEHRGTVHIVQLRLCLTIS